MKYVIRIFAILAIFIVVHAAAAEDVKRTATVLDTAGVTSEVSDLNFSGSLSKKFEEPWRRIAMSADPFDLAIPLDRLISIQANEKGHVVTYLWRGKEITTTGKLFSGKFTGKSDFGNLELDTGKLKSIKFDQAPTVKQTAKKAANHAILTLDNGINVNVDSLKRLDNYFTEYQGRFKTIYYHYTDLRFLRGESLVTVNFAKITHIEFRGEKGVSVTLKSGKKATGKISTENDAFADIIGFTGVFDEGEFFIAKKHLRTIEFASREE